MAKAKETSGMSMMEGVRRALDEMGKDAKPLAIQDYLKKTFQIDMPPKLISNYKTTLQKQEGRGKKRGRPRKNAAAKTESTSRHGGGRSTSSHGAISIEDIKAVKELAERIGVEKVKDLAAILAK